jgi:hypothetical protein
MKCELTFIISILILLIVKLKFRKSLLFYQKFNNDNHFIKWINSHASHFNCTIQIIRKFKNAIK